MKNNYSIAERNRTGLCEYLRRMALPPYRTPRACGHFVHGTAHTG